MDYERNDCNWILFINDTILPKPFYIRLCDVFGCLSVSKDPTQGRFFFSLFWFPWLGGSAGNRTRVAATAARCAIPREVG